MPISIIPSTTNYDATSVGPITSIDSLITETGYSSLPSSGKIKYILARSAGNIEVSVFFIKSSNFLSQSLFTLDGAAFNFTAATSSIISASNDDHDSLLMDADGTGLLGMSNSNSFTVNTWSKFRGSSVISQSVSLDSAVTYPASSNIGTSGTLVAFPGTSSGVWISLSGSQYKVNNGSWTSLPATLSFLGTGAPTNSLYTISDGINQFMIGRYGNASAAIVTVNLLTNTISATSITHSTNPVQSNATEEDCVGTQLFAVDATNTWHAGGTFYYGGGTGWKDNRNIFNTSGKSTLSIGNSTQTDMDVFGSIDTNNFVWFADWGHDDGGLFGVGNDSILGTRPTNIKRVPTIIGSGTPSEGLSANTSSAASGETLTVTLTTIGVANNTLVPYTITGVNSSDINGASLTGNFTVVNNTASVSFLISTSARKTLTLTSNGFTQTVSLLENRYGLVVLNETASITSTFRDLPIVNLTSVGNLTTINVLNIDNQFKFSFNQDSVIKYTSANDYNLIDLSSSTSTSNLLSITILTPGEQAKYNLAESSSVILALRSFITIDFASRTSFNTGEVIDFESPQYWIGA